MIKRLAAGAVLLGLMAASADAGQFLYNDGRGLRYSRPFPTIGQSYWPGPYYRGEYYARPYPPLFRPPPAFFPPVPLLPPPAPPPPPPAPRGDAIEEIRDPVTRQEVVAALDDYCSLKPDAPICGKLAPRGK